MKLLKLSLNNCILTKKQVLLQIKWKVIYLTMDLTKDFFNLVLDFGDDWFITSIDSDHKKLHVYLNVEYKSDYYEDPVSFQRAKLYDHTEVTVISHPVSGVVLDVGENRDGDSVKELLTTTFTDEQRKAMRTVSISMWKAYINSTNNKLPNAEIVHDKFHLIAY